MVLATTLYFSVIGSSAGKSATVFDGLLCDDSMPHWEQAGRGPVRNE